MKRKGYVVCKYVLYAGLLLFLIFPLYWIVTTAFRTDKEIVNSAMALIISIPAIALFLCTRKMFTNNLVGGIKG